MQKTLSDMMLEYNKRFDGGFPTISVDPDEAIKIIQDCIDKGQDAYALGYFSDDPDIKY